MGLGSLGKSPSDSMAVELGPPDFETSAQTLAKTLWGFPVAKVSGKVSAGASNLVGTVRGRPWG